MHKKTEKNNYALASSIISDIPLSIDKRDSQVLHKADAAEFKQNSSIYHTFNQSRSRADQSLSLHFSTARPFYGEAGEDYYQAREMDQKNNYNIQQKDHYIMERLKSKKSPNKKIMTYSYSNLVLFQKKVDKIFLEQKKRIFMMLYRVKKEDRAYLLQTNKKNTSFYSGQTNNTSREDAIYRVSFGTKRQERYSSIPQISQAISIIQGWFEYRMLLDKRKTINMIFQYGNDRKKFSLELSQSLKVDNAHNQNYYATDYYHSNEISLTNALPQQIQESLVYTLEHNSQSTRKELTQSTLQKLPTLKNYPTFPHLKQKTSNKQLQSETSKKNSPMLKLKSFNSSHASQRQEIKKKTPLNIQMRFLKNISISMGILNDRPLSCEKTSFQQQYKIDEHEVTAEANEISPNFKSYDTHQSNDFGAQLKKIVIRAPNPNQRSRAIQNSAKYSDVSNYRMENTVHKQQQPYQVIVNYVQNNTQHIIQDQTILRKVQAVPSQDKNIHYKVQRHFVAGLQVNAAIMTPRFTSEIKSEDHAMPMNIIKQKLVSQLDNDRIRIFGRPMPKEQQQMQRKQQVVVVPPRITKFRGNFSPQAPTFNGNMHAPITLSSQKRIISPKVQTERIVQSPPPIQTRHPHQPPPVRMTENPVRYEKRSPDYQIQRQMIQTARPQLVRPVQRPMLMMRQRLSPQVSNNIGIMKRQIPRNEPIIKHPMMSPQKTVSQQRLMLSRQKVINKIRKEDYGIVHHMPQQRQQYQVFTNISPINNHMAHVQRQYQLPVPEVRVMKPQSPPNNPVAIFRQNALMKDVPLIEKKPINQQNRPKSSASSPKLFFNYHSSNQSHVDEEIVINSNNLTKNSSSIKRPKSVNSKLFVTLKKQF